MAQAQEWHPIPGQPTSAAMHRELGLLEERAGVVPELASRLGEVGLAFGAFDVGFKIGTGINQKFLHLGLPPGRAPVDVADFVPASAYAWDGSLSYQVISRGDYYQTPTDPRPGHPSWYSAGDLSFTFDDGGLLIRGRTQDGSAAKSQLITTQRHEDHGPGNDDCHAYPTLGEAILFSAPAVEEHVLAWGGCLWWQPESVGFSPHSETDNALVQWIPSSNMDRTSPHPYDLATDGLPDLTIGSWDDEPSAQGTVEDRVASELGTHASQYSHLTAFLDSVEDNPPDRLDMPDCSGKTLQACLDALAALGFTGTHHTVTLDWSSAYVSKPARTVVKTSPFRGARVATDGEVTITRNPAPDQMPTRVPDITPGQTKTTVEQAVTDAGLEPVFTTAPTLDPEVGPERVTHTAAEPASDTKVAQGTEVHIEVNPDDAPEVAPSGSGSDDGSAGTTVGVDLEPLRRTGHQLCDTFPLGAPCWLVAAAAKWSATAQAPAWTFHLPDPISGGTNDVTLDLAVMEPAMVVLRPVIVVIATLSIVLWWASLAMFGGKNVASSGSSNEEE